MNHKKQGTWRLGSRRPASVIDRVEMKRFFCMVVFYGLSALGVHASAQKRITLSVKNMTLESVLSKAESLLGQSFL